MGQQSTRDVMVYLVGGGCLLLPEMREYNIAALSVAMVAEGIGVYNYGQYYINTRNVTHFEVLELD